MKLHDMKWDASDSKSLYDMIPSQELDVTPLDEESVPQKECSAASRVERELSKREQELASIEEFVEAKKAHELLHPTPPEEVEKVRNRPILRRFGQGRPRKHVMKEVTLVKLENGDYRLAGRGRPSAKYERLKIQLHYRWAQRLCQTLTYTAAEIEKMKSEP